MLAMTTDINTEISIQDNTLLSSQVGRGRENQLWNEADLILSPSQGLRQRMNTTFPSDNGMTAPHMAQRKLKETSVNGHHIHPTRDSKWVGRGKRDGLTVFLNHHTLFTFIEQTCGRDIYTFSSVSFCLCWGLSQLLIVPIVAAAHNHMELLLHYLNKVNIY